MGLSRGPFTSGFPGVFYGRGILLSQRQQYIKKICGGCNPRFIGLEHMRLCYVPDAMVQRSIPAGVPGGFEKGGVAFVRRPSKDIHIGNHGLAAGHSFIERWSELFGHESAQWTGQLVLLGGDQRHGVGVIGPIGGVCIDKDVWVQQLKNAVEALCVLCISFHKIPVQIEVA
ncbi:MAG: Uncharacterised protein [Flavobacteriia bacterium]|nr:MAG: Uncharacterised protein [Flavobacteriia bacterium]